MKRFIWVITIVMCIFITGCQSIDKKEEIEVTATVTAVQYKHSYITYIPMYTGKFFTNITQFHPEQYLVTVAYDDLSKTFDDETLYKKVKKGDKVELILYNGYDKEGNLVEQYLCLPE